MDDVVVVDEHDNIIGTVPKSEAHKTGIPHRVAAVYVGDGTGKFFVQIRRDGYLDHSAAGHVKPGESYEQAAKRELAEELGISDTPLERVGHATTNMEKYPDSISSHVFEVFACVAKPTVLQEDEVSGGYWATPEEIMREMQIPTETKRFCFGFKASLPLYADFIHTMASPL